jgi:hypothetical protein
MHQAAFCTAADEGFVARLIVALRKQTQRDMISIYNHTLRNISTNGF